MTLTKTGSQRMVKGIGNVVLALMLLWTAIPFYWMVVTSLKHDKEIYGYEATLIPEKPTLANYVTIFRDTPYLLFLRNSIMVAVGFHGALDHHRLPGGLCHCPAQFPWTGAAGARSGVYVSGPRARSCSSHSLP